MTDHNAAPDDETLIEAARDGDVATLSTAIAVNPEKLQVLAKPYEHSLLHIAAFAGQLQVVDLLIAKGADVNAREKGDNTYPMHWAAAAGHLEVVQHLADAGGDVVGDGDDHDLEVIGWATCWEGVGERHRDVADFLISRGAHHHLLSAISLGLTDEVRRIVNSDHSTLEKPMSRNEGHRKPLHYAVQRNFPDMVALLLELGADPTSTDDGGYNASIYANAPGADRPLLELARDRGRVDLFNAVALGDWDSAARLLSRVASSDSKSYSAGVLHLMTKRNNVEAVRWLLDNKSNPNKLWSHWGAMVTPMHLAAWQGHIDIMRMLLDAGGDTSIHDSEHDSDVLGWARYAQREDIVQLLESRAGF